MATQVLSSGIGERGAAVASTGYEYDAFVSYSDPDKDWTLSELIEPMQAAGLKVHHKDEFAIGGIRIDEHASAVERSRRIVIVMTPAWCESQWEAFDSLIAQTLNPGGLFPRLIPVIVKACTLPARIAALVALDYSDPALRRAAFDRLLRELGRSAREVTEANTRAARKGITALAELLRNPAVQSSLSSYQESIAEASDLIRVLGQNKRLHDYFQQAEGAYKLLLGSRKRVAAGGDTWDELEAAAIDLATELEILVQFARADGFPDNEILWTGRLERASAELKAAAMDQDDARLGGCCERLLKVLGIQPSRINDKLVTTAGQLDLRAVSDKLRKICAPMADVPFDEEAGARLEELRKGTESLDRLDQSLRILIHNHKCLQELDDSLRRFEMDLHPSPAEIAETWIDLGDPLRLLSGECGAAWLAGLRGLAARMDAAVERPPAEPRAVRELQALFREVRVLIYKSFNQTDADLRRFCEQLQKVGDMLSAAIGRMQYV